MNNTLIKGDTSEIWELGFQTSAEGVEPVVLADLSTDFTCKIAVKDTAINRTITDLTADNLYFRTWLNPSETLTLDGVVTVSIQISNPTMSPPLVLEKQIKLRMIDGVVPNG